MFHLIIIEDETATRSGLLKHMDWERLGISMIQTAASGQEAIDICSEYAPDIILSDIRMRGLDGLETCRILQEKYPDVQIIFFSGYAEKEYLKGAIELGAVNYVEKPANFTELEEAVKKATDALEKIRRNKSHREAAIQSVGLQKRRLFLSLLENDKINREENNTKNLWKELFAEKCEKMRIGIIRSKSPVTNMAAFLTRLDSFVNASALPQQIIHREFTDNRSLFILFGGSEAQLSFGSPYITAHRKAVENSLESTGLFFALGSLVENPDEIHISVAAAKKALASLFCCGYGCSTERGCGNEVFEYDSRIFEDFSRALSVGDGESAADCINKTVDLLISKDACMGSTLKNIIFTFDHEISQQFRRLFSEISQDGTGGSAECDFGKIECIETAEDVREYLLERINSLVSARGMDEINNNAAAQTIRFIQQHYYDNSISIKQLAQQVYLTPTYLASLFKQQTGKTIGEYLSALRIEKSLELLKDSQLKLYHVARQVGYEDPNYFAKVFKKYTGMTPSEYRDKAW